VVPPSDTWVAVDRWVAVDIDKKVVEEQVAVESVRER